MIQNGDLFTKEDLFGAMDELAAKDLRSHIPYSLGVCCDGERIVDLRELSPRKYADIMENAYDVPSSARALDKQLEDKGYRTTYKFAYEYHIPQQMRDRIVHDAYVLDYFMGVFNHPMLADKDIDIVKEYAKIAARHTYYYAQFIWANNPGVYDYKSLSVYEDWYHIWNFVVGVGYEFHPLDIKYHEKVFSAFGQVDKQEKQQQQTFKDSCRAQYGIDTGCLVLSDTNRKKLEQILKHQELPYCVQVVQQFLKKCFLPRRY